MVIFGSKELHEMTMPPNLIDVTVKATLSRAPDIHTMNPFLSLSVQLPLNSSKCTTNAVQCTPHTQVLNFGTTSLPRTLEHEIQTATACQRPK